MPIEMGQLLPSMSSGQLLDYMAECRGLVLEELKAIVPAAGELQPILYDLVFEYPMREAKALRPAVAVAVCRAFGGPVEGVLKSATVLELYHNAFLIHDDVEDGSELRRDAPTLHTRHGTPVAINVGDAMLALALQPLLDNVADLGLGRALRVMEAVSVMARESAEGQAIELAWTRSGNWSLRDRDYLRMVHKKTGWYTFITPAVIGGLVAGCTQEQLLRLRLFATALGTAFQIQDDILNLESGPGRYGKEAWGDLWEGKHTLILMHALRCADAEERQHALGILGRARPPHQGHPSPTEQVVERLTALYQEQQITHRAYDELTQLLRHTVQVRYKTHEDVRFLHDLVQRHDSIAYARRVAARRARRARLLLHALDPVLGASEHLSFLDGLIDFVVDRSH